MLKELIISLTLGVPTSLMLMQYLDANNREKRRIKNNFLYLFKEKNLQNSLGNYPKIQEITLKCYGFTATLDIKRICSHKDIENCLDYIITIFGATEVLFCRRKDYIYIDIITKSAESLNYEYISLNQYELLMGYNLKGEPLIVDMKKTPHLLIAGLSGTGKTFMVKTILRNLKDVSICVLNGFTEEFEEDDDITFVVKEKQIQDYLERIKAMLFYRNNPQYIILEEMQSFNNNKQIIELIKELLGYGRHYNLYVIGIIQNSTKENCKYKDLYGARCSFKQIDSSSYSVCLGRTIPDQLQNQEFYLYSTSLQRGKTYTI